MLDQTILFLMIETALAHDTHDNSEIVLAGSAPKIFTQPGFYVFFLFIL